jgi:hypothetical protein
MRISKSPSYKGLPKINNAKEMEELRERIKAYKIKAAEEKLAKAGKPKLARKGGKFGRDGAFSPGEDTSFRTDTSMRHYDIDMNYIGPAKTSHRRQMIPT